MLNIIDSVTKHYIIVWYGLSLTEPCNKMNKGQRGVSHGECIGHEYCCLVTLEH